MRISAASHTASIRPRAGAAQRRSVVTQVRYKGETVDGVTFKEDGKASGFRFDPSMQRWVVSKKADVVVETTVTPLQGDPYTVWPVIHYELKAKKLKGVDAEEAAKRAKKGWTLVDVRLPADFDKQHSEGAVNVPVFRVVTGTKPWDTVKKIVMAGLAMTATERDPDFIDNAMKQLRKNEKIIVMCAIGGTLDTVLRLRPDKYKEGIKDPERSFGRESRSLKACHEFIYKGGWNANNVVFLEGGFQQWRFQGFETESNK